MDYIIKAADLRIGSQIAEADGFLFDVIGIENETPKTITVRIASDFSSIPAHRKRNGGIIKTFKKSTFLYGIR